MKIIIATHNEDKLKEIKGYLDNSSFNIVSLSDFSNIGEIIENGRTLEDNALIKAREVFDKTGIPTISDDTGLEVDALDGEPGVYSARYAGENCTYSDNVNKLLKNMEKLPAKKRTARFQTAIAFVEENMELVSEGIVEGKITTKPKGVGGFGYDPVFYVPVKGKTFSEMNMTEKNQISHRSKAIQEMLKLLQSHLPNIFHQMEDIA